MPVPKGLTPRQAAERTGVCRATIYKLCEEGKLPHVRQLNNILIAPADLPLVQTLVRGGKRP